MRKLRGAFLSTAIAMVSLVSNPGFANPNASLAGGLSQLVAAYEAGDPRLVAQLKLHVTNEAGDPLVLVHLAPGADAVSVLQNLATVGFRFKVRSSINPSLVEGFLPLSDSFDTCALCATAAADDVASGDLPSSGVTVLEDSPGGTDEGRAMLQLVPISHLAPSSVSPRPSPVWWASLRTCLLCAISLRPMS